MNEITAHSMVLNEPFIYYSIKSVYDHVDLIFLTDTGSDHPNMLEDLDRLMDEDVDKKIRLEKLQYADHQGWTVRTPGASPISEIRQRHIDETRTKFFLVLDGDEVHFKDGMKTTKKTLGQWPDGMVQGFLPSLWYYDLNGNFFNKNHVMGRVFLTDRSKMNGAKYPNEMHIDKKTNTHCIQNKTKFNLSSKPFAHFETVVKPWRRKEYLKREQLFTQDFELPEVMVENDFFLKRFIKENNDSQ